MKRLTSNALRGGLSGNPIPRPTTLGPRIGLKRLGRARSQGRKMEGLGVKRRLEQQEEERGENGKMVGFYRKRENLLAQGRWPLPS